MEQNVTKTPEWSNDLAHFHVEELEERLENCWQGEEWHDVWGKDPWSGEPIVIGRVKGPCN